MSDLEQKPEKKAISRRTVTKAMAWSVPAIAIAAPVPAFALSGTPPVLQFLGGGKTPGNACNSYGFGKDYLFLVRVYNPEPKPIYVYFGSTLGGVQTPYVFASGDNGVQFFWSTETVRVFDPNTNTIAGPTGLSQMIGPQASGYYLINAGPQGNSSFGTISGTISLAWGHTVTAGDDPDHPYTPAPPNIPTGSGWVTTAAFSFPANPTTPNCYPPYTIPGT